MREKTTSGGSRPFLLSVLLTCALLYPTPAAAVGGLSDGQWDPRAANALSAARLAFGFASDSAFVTFRTTDCARKGVVCDSIPEGMMFWRTDLNVIRVCQTAPCTASSGWSTYNPAGGAGSTLDDVYTAGQSIVRDLLAFTITDNTAGASNTFVLNRTAGTGAVIDLSNAGTGNDITGDTWSVSTAGALSVTGVDLPTDSQTIVLGTSDDATLAWDGTSLVLTALADNQEVDLGVDSTGWDMQWHTGTAGDFMRFDASDKMLYAVDTLMKLGTGDIFYFGDGSGGAAAVDGDWAMYSDGTDLLLIPEAAGTNNIIIGADDAGADLTIYGDTSGSVALFDYNTSGDRLLLTSYPLQVTDGTSIGFGTGAGGGTFLGDILVSYDGAGVLAWTQGASGIGSITYGVDGKGIDQTWYGETASSAWTFDQDTDRLYATASHLHMGDASEVRMGNGTGTNGDMVLAYSAANVLSLTQTSAGAGADGTGVLTLGTSGEGFDVIFYGETAADEMRWDNDLDGAGAGALAGLTFSNGTTLAGDAGFSIALGATDVTAPADGFKLTSSATAMGINSVAAAAGDAVLVGNVAATDFGLWGNNGLAADQLEVSWDYSADLLTIDGSAGVLFNTNRQLQFGTTALAYAAWESVGGVPVLHLDTNAVADAPVMFGTDGEANGVPVYFRSATAGDYLWWDQDTTTLKSVDALVSLGDGSATDDALLFGAAAGGDVQMFYDGALNDLNLQFAAAGGLINLGGGLGSAVDVNWAPGMVQRVTFDDDDGGGAVPYVQHVSVYSTYNEEAPLYFDPAAPDLPADGMVIDSDSSAATDALYISSVAGTEGDAVVFGYDGAAAKATDVSFYGTHGAGADAITANWDYSEDSLSFTDADAGSWYADNAGAYFGNTVGTPDAKLTWCTAVAAGCPDADTLTIGTMGGGNALLVIGDDDATYQVRTVFGDESTKGISIDPNANAGIQIEYKVQKPVERIFIPASLFYPSGSAPAMTLNGVQYGYAFLEEAPANSVQTHWNAPKWMDTGVDVTAQVLFSCDGVAGNVRFYTETISIVPGTTLATDALTQDLVTATGINVIDTIYKSPDITIGAASFGNSSFLPTTLEVGRLANDAADTNTSTCFFYGLNMEVTRKYAD